MHMYDWVIGPLVVIEKTDQKGLSDIYSLGRNTRGFFLKNCIGVSHDYKKCMICRTSLINKGKLVMFFTYQPITYIDRSQETHNVGT